MSNQLELSLNRNPFVFEVAVTDDNIVTRHYFDAADTADNFAVQYTNTRRQQFRIPQTATGLATLLNTVLIDHTREVREARNAQEGE